MPVAQCVQIGLALTRALAHLHKCGLVHRNVKPSNVIFVGGVPKLADIGLVASVDATRSLVGTEGYVAPEGPGTPQADLYSLGKLLYEISTGCDRKEFPALPSDIASRPDRDALVELNAIIMRACQFDPRQRYANAEAMLAEMELVQRGQSVQCQRKLRQRWAIAKKVLAAAAVSGVLVSGGALLWPQSRAPRPLSKNPQAVALYKQALYQMVSDTVERRLEAYTNLTEAIKLDSGFVDAYFKLFEDYFDGYVGSRMPPHYDQMANFREVTKALRRVAPNSAQYHTANGMVEFEDWHFDQAIAETTLAKKLDPNFVRARTDYASFVLAIQGDAETALREFRVAERLDPNDLYLHIYRSVAYYMEGKFDLTIQQLLQVMGLESRVVQLHLNLGDAYMMDKQYEKALSEYEQFEFLNGADLARTKSSYESLRKKLNEHDPRQLWQAQLDRGREDLDPDWYRMARLCALLGNTDEAFRLLNRAYDEHSGWMVFLLDEPCFEGLQHDPRFQQLVKKMGFRPIPRANP